MPISLKFINLSVVLFLVTVFLIFNSFVLSGKCKSALGFMLARQTAIQKIACLVYRYVGIK